MISIQTDREKGIRYHVVTGKLSLAEVSSRLGELYEDKDFDPDMHVLWDLRGADVSSFTREDIIQLKDFVKKRWGLKGRSRAAFVVSKELDYGLARMYGILLEFDSSNEVRIFNTPEEAEGWIRS